ncbi:hypothetical protein P43SY_008657 [Pythium insidiosum]|uniref:PNPLA domain-containing protein n=1 Tax=Pythium insidiosum TaxID=114742 RepID=A0AAD5LHS6_PYTIN|nr:hypothetical protein P43SY_008657 [Pythium insidiosum]
MVMARSARSTRWKDKSRLASFIAHVISGLIMVSLVGSYVVRVVLQSVHNAPSFSELLSQRLELLPSIPGAQLFRCSFLSSWNALEAPALTDCARATAELHLFEYCAIALALLSTAALVITQYNWVGWYCWLQVAVLLQWCVAVYQFVRISLSLVAYVTVKTIKRTVTVAKRWHLIASSAEGKQADALRQAMKQASSYSDWKRMARQLDVFEHKTYWKTTISRDEHELCDFDQVKHITAELKRAIDCKDVKTLAYLVASVVTRNKHGVDNAELHLDCSTGTKQEIEELQGRILEALEMLAGLPSDVLPTHEKTALFRKLRQSFGGTALCLSGGGSIAMYHMGVIKALLEADMMPNVISGSSGGSITAALAACNTNEEMLERIIKNDIAVRYFPLGIRWFPPLLDQLEHCIKTGFLVKCSNFERTTRHYFSHPMDSEDKKMYYTFQDAFLKTGRHVCITVSASDVTGHKGPKKLLLNHINTPHVLLWSAVAVSCSLPGIMKGKKLMARDHNGNIVPYDAMGQEWVDGSIQHDLPMETMASCFNVTNFIVSQVNPHVVPFVGDDVHKPTFRKSLFHTLESVIAADVRHRLKMLAFLGLFPKIYGHQFSSYFKQNFSGNVTLIPDFVFLEAIGVKAILNPTKEDMDRYILGGQRAVWPKLAYIGHLCAIEKCLDRCLEPLMGAKLVRYENWLHPESKEKESWRRRDVPPGPAFSH